MHIVVVGLNHRSAPIELRERLAFRREHLPSVFARLRDDLGVTESAVLSTCNRVEIYARVPEVDGAVGRLQRFLSDHARVELPQLSGHLYNFAEPQSVRHLFAVASGLDSMVLGEAEILCQVKHAYEWAKDSGATGKVLNVLFQRALNAAKAVRADTAIGYGATSIGTVAVELSEKIFGDVSRAVVVLVGAGAIGELTLKRLAERGVRNLRVLNRSVERAVHVAAAHGIQAVPMEDLAAQLLDADVLIASTNAPAAWLSRSEVAAAMRQRHQRPLCIVDLGVPRNVEAEVGALENVYLFNIDDLQGVVEHHHAVRRQALEQSQQILEQKVTGFLSWWQEEVVPCVPAISSGPVAAR